MKKIILLALLCFCFNTHAQCYSAIATKGMHNLAIKSDGTLWAWGQNNNGQIGNNSSTNQLTPVQIGKNDNWWKISAGTYYSTAIKTDGTLWAWGSNSYGQTGILTTNYPHMIGTDNDWVHVATGLAFTSAIKSDGTLWMWGYNAFGQLGNGTTINSNVPAQVGTDNDWVFTSHGSQHILALKSDGTLWSWGYDSSGALGLGSLGNQSYPTQIGTDSDWVQVCAGYSSGAAIKSNGTLWTWGYNDYGMVGDGTIIDKQSPVQIGGNDWQSVTITTHTMAIKTNGTLWIWGRNDYGKIGNGVVNVSQTTPLQIGTATDWIKVLPGFEHSLALKGNGTLWAWGHNNYGQLGDNTTVDKIVPTQTGSICNEPLCTIVASTLPAFTAQCSVAQSDITIPTMVDNCGNTITATLLSGTFPITTQGTTTITWKFQNAVNTIIASQNIVIADTIAPQPTVATLPTINAQCQLAASAVTPPTAQDACAGTITGTTATVFPITAQGITTITWAYNDGNGNTSSQTQTVIIDDTTAPVPTVATLPTINAQCQLATTAVTAPTALDTCAGTITGTTATVFPITIQGTSTITWTYNDGNGNTSSQTQTVVVDNTTVPVPSVATLPTINAQCQLTANAVTAPTAQDTCAAIITGTTTTVFPITAQGTSIITWTYNDGNGNTSSQIQTVVIDDITAPVPTVASLPATNAQCQVAASAVTAPTALDACTGTITSTTATVFPITAQGITTITWMYNDGNGNTSSQTQTVVINDTTPPEAISQDITVDLNGNVSVSITPSQVDNGSSDNCNFFTLSLDIDTFTQIGSYSVSLTITDAAGNTDSATAVVTVIDSSLASDSFEKNGIRIYPVPAQDHVTIVSDDIDITSVEVYSLKGEKVSSITGDVNRVDVIGLSDGTYYLMINTTDGIYKKQLIIKR